MYPRTSFGHTAGSPPSSAYRTESFGAANGAPQTYGTSSTNERHGSQRNGAAPMLAPTSSDPSNFGHPNRAPPTIVIRRLSRHISSETLSGMLTFSADLLDTEFIPSPYVEDEGFATAVARFRSQVGALEAQQKLHGKPNTTKEATMIVEVHSAGAMGSYDRRNTIDGSTSRTQTSSASSGASATATGTASRSRFGGAFQSPDQASPPIPTPSSATSGDLPSPESHSHWQNVFSPQSPLANGFDDRQRMSGKYMINSDAVDLETGELLRDPVAYAQIGQQQSQPLGRRQTSPAIPIGRFNNLSLSNSHSNSDSNTNGNNTPNNLPSSPPNKPLTSPRQSQPLSPTFSPPSYPRAQYPPVNPADQNPPCNTLYVGNLPLDTSEDELKTIFSKQRGYKRLCFRTKQNGPMCFVEFEDVSFATKALNELYGVLLHNSVKGGIRLSFSKNPLGVRSGQMGNGLGFGVGVGMGMGPGGQIMSPHALAPGFAGMNGAVAPAVGGGAGFSTVSGPPPGLGGPQVLNPHAPPHSQYRNPGMGPQVSGAGGNGMEGMFANPFGLQLPQHPPQEFAGQLQQGVNGGATSGYGRDSRGAGGQWSDYMLGR